MEQHLKKTLVNLFLEIENGELAKKIYIFLSVIHQKKCKYIWLGELLILTVGSMLLVSEEEDTGCQEGGERQNPLPH